MRPASSCTRNHRRPWTVEENRWLVANWRDYDMHYCARVLGRSPAAVSDHARTLGLRKAEPAWTPEDERRLVELYNIIGPAATARELRRSQKSCWNKAYRLGLTGRWRARWTTRQVARVRAVLEELCGDLGRTPDAIAVRMRLCADEMQAGKRKRRKARRRYSGRHEHVAGLTETLAEIAAET